jgi:flagellar biosynthesis component FlhA
MQDRIRNAAGIPAPGFLFQEKANDPQGWGYEIELDGVIQVSGWVPLEHRFTPTSPEEVAGLGVPAEHVIDMPDPATGRQGSWVASVDTEPLEGKLELWPEPLSYVVRHLEVVVRANLGGFVDLEKVEALLDTWSLDPQAAQAIEALLPRRSDRIVFARLVRTLVSEGVPVGAWRDVLDPLEGVVPEPDRVDQAVAAIRRAMGDRLPGLAPSMRRVPVPPEWVEELTRTLRGEREGQGTGLPAALVAFRERLGSLADRVDEATVLVAPDPTARGLIRRLAALAAPQAQVVSADELASPDGPPPGEPLERIEHAA